MIFQKQELIKPIQKLMPIVSARLNMPILANILITFLESEVQFYATNLEISTVISIPREKNDKFRQVCIHGRNLYDLLRTLDNDEVHIEMDDTIMRISQGKAKFKLPMAQESDFPDIPEFQGTAKLAFKAEDLRRYFDTVDHAVATDETRHILTGIYLSVDDNGNIAFVATDGFRMAVVTSQDPSLTFADVKCVIPKNAVSYIKELLEGEILIEVSKSALRLKSGQMTAYLRLIDGSFPDYKTVVPENGNMVVIRREEFNRALRQAQAIKGDGLIELSMAENKMSITSMADAAEVNIDLEAQYSGKEIAYQFRSKNFTDAIAPLQSDDIHLSLPDNYGAAVIREDSYTSVIMPIRG